MSILELIAKLKEIEGVVSVKISETGDTLIEVSDPKWYPEVKRCLEEFGLAQVVEPASRKNPYAN